MNKLAKWLYAGEPTVFEIRNTTDDEIYYPLGYYLNFEMAKAKIESYGSQDQITDNDDDFEQIEIIAHAIGWGGDGKEVYILKREREYVEPLEDYCWKVTKAYTHPDYRESK